MTNKITAVSVGAALMLLGALGLAMPASAAIIPGFYDAIFEGQTETWVNQNDNIGVEFRLESEGTEWVYAVSTDVIGDGIGFQCHEFSAFGGLDGTYRDIRETHDGPPNTGDFGFRIDVFTADTETEANALRNSTNCSTGGDEAFNDGDVVHVLPNDSGTGGSGSSDDGGVGAPSVLDELQNNVNKLQEMFNCYVFKQCTGTTTPPVAPTGACAEYATLVSGLSKNSDTRPGGRVGQLQSFLMYKGFNIPLLANNQAPYGYFGDQTDAAAQNFKAANQCI